MPAAFAAQRAEMTASTCPVKTGGLKQDPWSPAYFFSSLFTASLPPLSFGTTAPAPASIPATAP
jgi:hypothetical protein